MDRIGLHPDNQSLGAVVAFASASAVGHTRFGIGVIVVAAESDIQCAVFAGQGTLSVQEFDMVKYSLWVGTAFAFGRKRSLGT